MSPRPKSLFFFCLQHEVVDEIAESVTYIWALHALPALLSSGPLSDYFANLETLVTTPNYAFSISGIIRCCSEALPITIVSLFWPLDGHGASG